MSTREKLANEWALNFLPAVSDAHKASFLAGYAACEERAQKLVKHLERVVSMSESMLKDNWVTAAEVRDYAKDALKEWEQGE